jgi:membrane-associated phospholipid phosphatase
MKNRPKFLPVDLTILIYLIILSVLIIAFRKNQTDWVNYLLFNFFVALAVFSIVRFFSTTDKISQFLRHWYPILFYLVLYEENRYLIHLLFPGWFDGAINNLEMKIFGFYPTVWLEKIISVPLNEYMMFSYFFYYFLPLILGVGLYFGKKISEFDRFVFTSSVGLYISYLGFIFYPIEGPRYALAHSIELKGVIFTPLAQYVIKVAGLHGGCMPSPHCTLAFIILVYSFRYHKTIFYFLSPLILSLFVATVYGRFHYLSDVVAGILVGIFSIVICDRINSFLEKNQKTVIPEKKEKAVQIPS